MPLRPEILSPAGNLRKCQVALAYGADAIYVGAAGLSMRPESASLGIDDLTEALRLVHTAGKKLYVAVNTLAFPGDLPEIKTWLQDTKSLAFDALIISDPGVMMLARTLRPDVPIHISTQQSVANEQAAIFWKEAGASRVVLARECSLADTRCIVERSGVGVEIFVHGSMCVAVSGRCLLSSHLTGHSASRGSCKHSCRWNWQLIEEKRPGETFPVFETGKETIFLGSTDLCLLPHTRDLLQSGACSWKIEGRMKSEYYVAVTTAIYKQARDAALATDFTVQADWDDALESMSHRPFAPGFAFGYAEPSALQTDNQVRATHQFLGIAEARDAAAACLLVRNPFTLGEEIEQLSPTLQPEKCVITEIRSEAGERKEKGHPGQTVWVEASPPIAQWSLLRRPLSK